MILGVFIPFMFPSVELMPQKQSYSIMQLVIYHFHHLNVTHIVKIDEFAFLRDFREFF